MGMFILTFIAIVVVLLLIFLLITSAIGLPCLLVHIVTAGVALFRIMGVELGGVILQLTNRCLLLLVDLLLKH